MQYATVFSGYGESTVSTYGQMIRRVINNDGFGGEHSFAVGANFGNNLYIGATLGYSRFNYAGHYEHLETDQDNSIYDFSSFSYVDHYEADGSGLSLKAGFIYIPFDFLRFGLAVHSPVIYSVSEYYYEDLSSVFDNGDRYEFNSDAFRFSYRLTTPYRILGGVALQIQKSALISLDYEFVDYSISRQGMASDGYDYYDENQSIKDIFTASHNIRAGAEYRLGSVYFRGGYGYYGTVFSKDEVNRDNFHTSLSGGIGFRQSNFFIDLAFTRLSDSMIYYMYNYQYVDPVTIETTRSNFSATVGFKF
jgi:long-subunit fatty acid transport protein